MLLAALSPSPKLPALDAPFTLVYKATLRDVRPKAVKDAALMDVRRELAARVADGALGPEAAEKATAAFAKTLDAPPATTTLTLSYDGRTLLIDEAAVATLLAPGGTFRFVKGPTDGVRGVWSPGVEPGEARVPFVGAPLPILPALRANLARDPRGAVTRAATPAETTVLSAHVPLRGALVGRWIVRTDAATRTEYSLVSQLAAALPADRFLPDRYVADGDEIALKGRPNLIVDPRKGGLVRQIALTLP